MPRSELRLTGPSLMILRTFLESSNDLSGSDIAKGTRLASGTLYPLLARLESAGWAASRWEEVDPREAGRPRRRFYHLTKSGRAHAHEALSALQLIPAAGAMLWNA